MEVQNAHYASSRGARRRHPGPNQGIHEYGKREDGLVVLPRSSSTRLRRPHPQYRTNRRPPPLPPPPPPTPHVDATVDFTASNQTQVDESSEYESDNDAVYSTGQGSGFSSWYSHLTHDHHWDGTSASTTYSSRYHRRTTVTASSTSSFQLTAYVQLLAWMLTAWVLYLLLPRGLRKTYCTTDRRRHRRHRQVALLPNQKQPFPPMSSSAAPAAVTTRPVSPPLNISVPRIRPRDIDRPLPSQTLAPRQQPGVVPVMQPVKNAVGTAAAARMRGQDDIPRRQHTETLAMRHSDDEPPTDDLSRDESLVSLLEDSQFSNATTATATDDPTASATSRLGGGYQHRYHPAVPIPPSVQILRDTFSRLETGGIRLVAHGIHCESKRVWIRITYDRLNLPDSFAVRWQTEVCRTITAADGRVSKVWVKRGGAGHTLPLRKVLCVDVGKNTSALASKAHLDPATCLSLLTATGSLDLEARSQLERDAIVCCLSRLLDQVHDVDWRQLYRESPEPSTVTSAVISTTTFGMSIADTSAAVADAESSMDDLSLI